MGKVEKKLKVLLEPLNISIAKHSKIERLKRHPVSDHAIEFVAELPREMAPLFLRYVGMSHSQLYQDLFVLTELNFKREGFFVEFGAMDGVNLSNTYLMAKEFGWRGILAEPAHCWRKELGSNRTASIDTACVWRDTESVVEFKEAFEFSTISDFSHFALPKKKRDRIKTYQVQTISLVDLLIKHRAPREIDYLSVDTEGSEFDILEKFDFDAYSFRIITCEHIFTPNREKIHDLLTKRGYARKYENLSSFEDWYVKR